MNATETNPDVIVDFITGETVPNVGTECHRQQLERYLVEQKGYRREEVLVDAPIQVDIDGEVYRSKVDLVIRIDGRPLMAVKCAAGSLGSREREILSAARLFGPTPLPLAVVSDGATATVLDVASGKKKGEGLAAFPHRTEAADLARAARLPPITPERLTREKRIFRSYDSMNVNVHTREE
jgi:Type I restriction enzyme R protein N terminus (HSDR_N)